MIERRIQLLDRAETMESTLDARIVALRWDLLAWDLVLDCDLPAFGERDSNAIKRGWIVFDSVGEISLTLDSARLPRGIIAVSSIGESPLGDNCSEFNISVLIPRFSEDDKLVGNPGGVLTISAKSVLTVRSIAIGDFGEHSGDVFQRNSLADDNDFLEAIKIRV
jgi:hypothetical protein